jgi:hypothetical protein
MTTLQENKFTDTSIGSSAVYSLSGNNLQHIIQIKSFAHLPQNWDSYNADAPSTAAIAKAVAHIFELNSFGLQVYFTSPTRDGDIVIEVKNGDASLEFIFAEHVSDRVILIQNGAHHAEYPYYNSNITFYLKWLIYPNGNC